MTVLPRPGRGAPAARLIAALAIAVVAMVAGARPASAHAQLVTTVPAAGDQLEAPPEQILLQFTEGVELPEVRLLDAQGQDIALGDITQPDNSSISVAVPVLGDGGYVVAWSAVSEDGHPVNGAFTFAVGNAPLPDAAAVTGTDESEGGWALALDLARAVQYAGLVLGVGLWAFVVICWWQGRDDPRVSLVVILGAIALAVGSAARIAFQARLVGSGIADVLRTDAGRAWMSALVLALPLGLLATSLARLLTRAVHGVALAVLAVLLGRAIAIGGHGATGRSPLLGDVLTIGHVAAVSVWIGGLVGVLLSLRRAAPDVAERAVRRFSDVALASVGLVAVTGTFQAARRLETLDALTESAYGRTLIIKLVVIAVLLAVAGLTRFSLRSGELVIQPAGREERRWAWPRVVARTVGVEVVLAATVLGITGALAGASPLVDTSSDPVNLALVQGERTAYISIFPARTGTNSIHVTIDEPSIEGPDEITVELSPADGSVGSIDVPVVDAGPGHVIADAAVIPFAGEWTIDVAARYGEFDLVDFVGTFPVG